MLLIQVKSGGYESGNMAGIMINDIPVQFEKNENNHLRGLHIVIINSMNGKVEMTRVFDTYKTSDGFH